MTISVAQRLLHLPAAAADDDDDDANCWMRRRKQAAEMTVGVEKCRHVTTLAY